MNTSTEHCFWGVEYQVRISDQMQKKDWTKCDATIQSLSLMSLTPVSACMYVSMENGKWKYETVVTVD